MSRPRTEDIVASIEDYIQAAWPDANVAWSPTAHDAQSAYTGTEDAWAALQWIGPVHDGQNRNDIVGFDLRILVFSREADRLAAARRADSFMLLVDDTTVTIYDRTDSGSTETAKAVFQSATASAPELDQRGVRMSVVETSAVVYPS